MDDAPDPRTHTHPFVGRDDICADCGKWDLNGIHDWPYGESVEDLREYHRKALAQLEDDACD